jgi:hypothetical protein
MRILSRLALSIGLFATLVIVETAQAATYYVDRNLPGNDSNSGTTEATAFLTIARCVAVAINPGDTCLVKNGNYPEPWRMMRSGTAGSPITLKNYPGHAPTIRMQPTDPTTTMPPNQPSTALQLLLSAGFSSSMSIGWIVIEGFEVSHGYAAFPCDNCHDIVYRRNKIHHFYLGAFGGNGTNITLDRNIIYHNGRFAECAAFPSGGGPSVVNVCNQDQGIYYRGTNFIITNNLIYDGLSYGIQVAGYPSRSTDPSPAYSGANNWLIANNTIAYQNYRHAIVLWDGGGGCTNIRVENNIFYQNAQFCPSCGNGVDIISSSTSNMIRNNLFYATTPGGTIPIQNGTNGTSYNASNNLLNTDNPNFVNGPSTVPAAPDFRLNSNSPVIDKGLTEPFTTDLVGSMRPVGSGYDIGAYESGGQLSTNAPAPPKGLKIF